MLPGMKIALFSEVFLPKVDGITNRLRHTLECLQEEGHETLLFAPDTALPAYGATRVVRVPSLPFPPYPGVRVPLPDPRIAAALASFAPDVVHAVGPACLGVAGAGRVHFPGLLRGEELARAFASADLFAMPSRTETLGFVVLEAMASGLPVVAAHAGGIPDLVRHGEDGLLFDPGRPRELVEAVAALLGDEARRRSLARAGRKAAEQASWRSETRRLLDAYRRAIVLARQSRGAMRRLGSLLFARPRGVS